MASETISNSSVSSEVVEQPTRIATYYPSRNNKSNEYYDTRMTTKEFKEKNSFIKCGCCNKDHVFKTVASFNMHIKSDNHKKKIDSMNKFIRREPIMTPLPLPTASQSTNMSEQRTDASYSRSSTSRSSSESDSEHNNSPSTATTQPPTNTTADAAKHAELEHTIIIQQTRIQLLNAQIQLQNNFINSLITMRTLPADTPISLAMHK